MEPAQHHTMPAHTRPTAPHRYGGGVHRPRAPTSPRGRRASGCPSSYIAVHCRLLTVRCVLFFCAITCNICRFVIKELVPKGVDPSGAFLVRVSNRPGEMALAFWTQVGDVTCHPPSRTDTLHTHNPSTTHNSPTSCHPPTCHPPACHPPIHAPPVHHAPPTTLYVVDSNQHCLR
jgi:hypothetical protein